jgi:cytochrome d ubiquinol oxidase subunit II
MSGRVRIFHGRRHRESQGAAALDSPGRLPDQLAILTHHSRLAIANMPREFHQGRDWRAFLSSCAAIITLMALFAVNIFPNLVYNLPHPENSLTIYNASSSPKTLGIMLVIACIGVPVVIAYTVCIYWIFRGKVKLDRMSC